MSNSGPSARGHPLDQGGEQVDAEATCCRSARCARGRRRPGAWRGRPRDRPVVPTTWTMRACAASSENIHGRRRHGEVEHAVARRERRERVVGDGHAERVETGERAGIVPDRVRALALDRRRERAALGLRHGADQHLAHAPVGAHHHQPHGLPASSDPWSRCTGTRRVTSCQPGLRVRWNTVRPGRVRNSSHESVRPCDALSRRPPQETTDPCRTRPS